MTTLLLPGRPAATLVALVPLAPGRPGAAARAGDDRPIAGLRLASAILPALLPTGAR